MRKELGWLASLLPMQNLFIHTSRIHEHSIIISSLDLVNQREKGLFNFFTDFVPFIVRKKGIGGQGVFIVNG